MIHIEDYYASVLGEFEQLVLLALLRLGNGAYGATIRREIRDRTKRDVPIGSVYVTLARLERKEMVVSYVGLPSKERGGRRRKHYLMNEPGQRALGRAYRALKAMAQGFDEELEKLVKSRARGSRVRGFGARGVIEATSRRIQRPIASDSAESPSPRAREPRTRGPRSLDIPLLTAVSHSPSMGKMKARQDLLPGTLDMLILKSLTRGVMHGYGIVEHIRTMSDEVLKVEEGSLYPALQRLQLQGLIDSEWGHSVNNRRARYYRLTAAGRRQLGQVESGLRAADRGDRAGHEAGRGRVGRHGSTPSLSRERKEERERMMRTSMWWRRAAARLTRNRLDDEMQEEIRDHLERRRQQLIADGIDPGGRGRRGAARLRQRRERPRAAARRLGLPVARQPAAGRRATARDPAARPGIHRGRGPVAVARHRRSGGRLQRRRRRAVPAAQRQGSRQPSRLPRRDRSRRRTRRKTCSARLLTEIEAMRAAADFADLIAFRTVDDVPAGDVGGDAPHGAGGAGVARLLRGARRPGRRPAGCSMPAIADRLRSRSSSASGCGAAHGRRPRRRRPERARSTASRRSSSASCGISAD